MGAQLRYLGRNRLLLFKLMALDAIHQMPSNPYVSYSTGVSHMLGSKAIHDCLSLKDVTESSVRQRFVIIGDLPPDFANESLASCSRSASGFKCGQRYQGSGSVRVSTLVESARHSVFVHHADSSANTQRILMVIAMVIRGPGDRADR